MFTSDVGLLASVCTELLKVGCCPRCVLRYVGLKDMFIYKGDHQAMEKIVKQYQHQLVSAAPLLLSDGDSVQTEPNSHDPLLGESNAGVCIDSENKKKSTTEQMCTSKEKQSNGVDKIQTEENFNPSEQPADKIQTEENFSEQPALDVSTCVVCLGILQKFVSDQFLNQIREHVTAEGFHYSTYMCSLMVPVCIILREHSMWLHLQEKFKELYSGRKLSDIAPVKDIWKWRCGPLLTELLGTPFDARSPFEITLTFKYDHADRECNFLLDTDGDETFRQRKQDRRYSKKKKTFALFTRANVAKAVDSISAEDFKRNFQCPPPVTSCETTCDIQCQSENIFVAGRYNKYSRTLSQSPWLIEGVRKSESSVEELLGTEICKHFRPSESKFSSSGREDVDVLMLGNGRPFIIELINPRKREFTQQQMNEMQKTLNANTKDVRCTDLQIVSREETDILKQGEIDKVKKYRGLCWSKLPITDDHLRTLSSITELKILQKTPIRVLHRRPLATRDKIIHSIAAERVDDHHFTLDMSTQAGTYIKEFVHGDFGRTRPNVCTLLSQDCDILELDVTAVELDWPKKIKIERD